LRFLRTRLSTISPYEHTGKTASENIQDIDWTISGKIKRIILSSPAKPLLEFKYDAAGNRVSKKVTYSSGAIVATYYVRDAQGNIMSTCNVNINGGARILTVAELNLYGSSRLGVKNANKVIGYYNGVSTVYPGMISTPENRRTLGEKSYELSNHLGNVLAVISDRKLPVAAVNTQMDYFVSDIFNATDYYAFGAPMPGRQFNNSNYRYGFNGKENDNEVKGTGNQQDYGMRIYDPRLGKFLSTDPIAAKYPELTPYQFASNRPIDGIDMDGLEYLDINLVTVNLKDGRSVFKIENYDVDGSYLTWLAQGKGISIHWKGSPQYQHIQLNSLEELNGITPDNFSDISKAQTQDACARWAMQTFISQHGENKLLPANYILTNAFYKAINQNQLILR
jgi:RHS repeat-associated protein